ncbi:cupin domain-containing protein 5 [Elsinoe australis]|uniref:Cupin domain-containing protein 5 n=1 Tax=Elsinoe australis TaxID=40998 RepID=A0A4U7B3Q1_9PEZI|nr:cupin domain-containing protein 5 [Elsinoe australis]
MSNVPETGLRKLHRYITDHDNSGKAIISDRIPSELPLTTIPSRGAVFALQYSTTTFPAKLDGSDLDTYESHLKHGPGVAISQGTVIRTVDMEPGHLSPMHRTISLDYGIVVEGEIEIVLDSGETRLLKRGDSCIQRATNHAWRNPSKTEWARVVFILVGAEKPKVNGKELDEVLNGADQGQNA